MTNDDEFDYNEDADSEDYQDAGSDEFEENDMDVFDDNGEEYEEIDLEGEEYAEEPEEKEGYLGGKVSRRGVITGAGALLGLGTLGAIYAEQTDMIDLDGKTASGDDYVFTSPDNETATPDNGYTDEGPTTAEPSTPEPTTEEPAPANGDTVLGPDSDRLYLQDDGTVIGVDIEDKEWRRFHVDEFPENSELSSLYTDLEGSRESETLPFGDENGSFSGIRVSRQEVMQHSASAYDDMADEAEWDIIFDDNPEGDYSF